MSPGLRFRPAAALAIGVLIGVPFALGQEPSGPPPKDTIFARKILMGAIDMNMDEIETMLAPNGKLDAAEAREHADTISVMLMSFPCSGNQSVEARCRSRCGDRYVCLARPLVELCGFL